MENEQKAELSTLQASKQDQAVTPSCPPSNTTPAADYRHLTLDPNSAYRELVLSAENRKVELTDLVQAYPEHPDRFSHLFQVLCAEALLGRCYWEVEFNESVEIAVAYKDLGRSDYYAECAFGCNDKSWSLDLNRNYKCFRHNDEEIAVPEPQSSRVGVYLDHEAGVLTYYCVCDTMLQLMHREETSFTQPLYPGLWVAGSAQLCDPE